MEESETVSALSDLLNSKPITARQAAEKAEEMGIPLPYGTIAAYWSGGHGRPSASTLAKLARVVEFTEKQLQEAAWNTTAPLGQWVPPEESIHLDQHTRKALDNLIRSVVAATRGSSNAVETAPQPHAQTEGHQGQEDGLQKPERPRAHRIGTHPRTGAPIQLPGEDGADEPDVGNQF